MAGEAVSDRSRSSAWPVFVALGLAVGEVGVVLALYPVAVAGLVLFVGSIACIVSEAGYAETPWPVLAGLGVVLLAFGVWVVSTQVAATPADWLAAIGSTDAIVLRGFSIVIAGVVAVFAAGAGSVAAPSEPVGA
jgi:hypothetical protein